MSTVPVCQLNERPMTIGRDDEDAVTTAKATCYSFYMESKAHTGWSAHDSLRCFEFWDDTFLSTSKQKGPCSKTFAFVVYIDWPSPARQLQQNTLAWWNLFGGIWSLQFHFPTYIFWNFLFISFHICWFIHVKMVLVPLGKSIIEISWKFPQGKALNLMSFGRK